MATAVAVTEVPKTALPMNAEEKHSVADAAGKHASVLEPKYDGWRILWEIDSNGHARSFTRTGNEQTGKMPAIEAELAAKLPAGTILDSEVVAFKMVDGHLSHDRGKVQSVLGSGTAKAALASGALSLVVFDLIAHGGIDARAIPFAALDDEGNLTGRRKLLEQVFASADFNPSLVVLTPQLDATQENYDALIEGGYEGGMVKWRDAPYRSGARGKGWFKMKAHDTADVIVMGYKDGTPGSSFDGVIGAIEFGQYDENGFLVHLGRCSGMDWDVRLDVTAHKDAYLGHVFELGYLSRTAPSEGKKYGAFLSPNWKAWRPDKPATDCTITVCADV